jgi:precorrin-6A synthase
MSLNPLPPSPSRAAPRRRVLVVGIGAGDPEHLTLGAVRALNETDVVFLVDKGETHTDLRQARLDLCHRIIDPRHPWRVEEVELGAVRDRGDGPYRATVAAWRAARVAAYGDLVGGLHETETGAFLVWGDPTLYDGTLDVLAEVRAAGDVAFDVEVVPGISSVSALAARHGVTLNRPGEPVQITTGRRLAREGMPEGIDSVVVVLDTHEAWRQLDDDLDIWWGAFVGLPGERLVTGRLGDQRTTIGHERAAARSRHGWVFDTYLLRRRAP